jgi:hypothetical protein
VAIAEIVVQTLRYPPGLLNRQQVVFPSRRIRR